jgi:hypothetical protein
MRRGWSPTSSPLIVEQPRAAEARTVNRLPIGVVWAAGTSTAAFVVAFMVIPWPTDLLVVPALLVWSLLLSGLLAPAGWKQPRPVLALVGLCALVLGSVMTALVSLVS